jgi:energy-coupling factor transporter ATP-binding protein EcfA2
MKLHPFSSQERGVFVSVDGPSGAGKSTIVRHLAQMLVAAGEDVHVTAEPSEGPIGQLCRELTESVTGRWPVCMPLIATTTLSVKFAAILRPVKLSLVTAISRPAWSCSGLTALTPRFSGSSTPKPNG